MRVYLDGCFDVMHYGHANALRQARMLGDELVVGLISDDEIRAAKGPPVMNYAERKTLVGSVKWVDEVIDGEAPPAKTISQARVALWTTARHILSTPPTEQATDIALTSVHPDPSPLLAQGTTTTHYMHAVLCGKILDSSCNLQYVAIQTVVLCTCRGTVPAERGLSARAVHKAQNRLCGAWRRPLSAAGRD